MRLLFLLPVLTLAACDSSGADPEIVRYTGAPITEADATIPNEPFEPVGWSGGFAEALNGQFVTITQQTLCGDECGQSVRFSFESPRNASLPTSVEGVYDRAELLPERFETRQIEIARVEIQDWGPDLVSGVIYPVTDPDAVTVPYVFWADDLDIPTVE